MDYALDNETMQKLIDNLHANEMKTILQFRYQKPQARTDDIFYCQQVYQRASALLQEEVNAPAPQAEDGNMMQQFWAIVRSGIRLSYELIKNYKLRGQYIKVYESYSRSFSRTLQEVIKSDENVRKLVNAPPGSPVKTLEPFSEQADSGFKNPVSYRRRYFKREVDQEDLEEFPTVNADDTLHGVALVDSPNEVVSNYKLSNLNSAQANHTVSDPDKFKDPSGTIDQVELNDSDELSLPDQSTLFEIQIKAKLKSILRDEVNQFSRKIRSIAGMVSPTWAARTDMTKETLDQLLLDVEMKHEKLPDEMTEQEYGGVMTDTFREFHLKVQQDLNEMKYAGRALLIVSIGVLLWNIKESPTPTLETIKGVLSLGASLAAGTLGTLAGSAAGAFGGPVGVFIGGVLGGIICSFLSGLASDSIFDALVSVFDTSHTPEPIQQLFGQPILYEIQLPDNLAISNLYLKNLLNKA